MTDTGIDAPVRALIAEHIGSVEQLEVLLWMHAHPGQDWTADEVSDQLRSNPLSAAARLRDLGRRGFLAGGGRRGSWRWDSSRDDLHELVSALARAYAERRYTVIELVFSKSEEQLRQLAEAFRLRREDDRDG